MNEPLNEDELSNYCLEHAGEVLPPEALEHLRRNPALKAEVDGLAAVGRMMALARYTVPDPAASRRCAMAVQARIEQARHTTWLGRLKEWALDGPAAPSWAYGSAVAALLVAGVVLLYPRPEEGGQNVVVNAVEVAPVSVVAVEPVVESIAYPDLGLLATVEEVEEEPPVLPVLADLDKPLIFLRVQEEPPPPSRGRMTFGGDSSVPVSYQY